MVRGETGTAAVKNPGFPEVPGKVAISFVQIPSGLAKSLDAESAFASLNPRSEPAVLFHFHEEDGTRRPRSGVEAERRPTGSAEGRRQEVQRAFDRKCRKITFRPLQTRPPRKAAVHPSLHALRGRIKRRELSSQ